MVQPTPLDELIEIAGRICYLHFTFSFLSRWVSFNIHIHFYGGYISNRKYLTWKICCGLLTWLDLRVTTCQLGADTTVLCDLQYSCIAFEHCANQTHGRLLFLEMYGPVIRCLFNVRLVCEEILSFTL